MLRRRSAAAQVERQPSHLRRLLSLRQPKLAATARPSLTLDLSPIAHTPEHGTPAALLRASGRHRRERDVAGCSPCDDDYRWSDVLGTRTTPASCMTLPP